MLSRLAFLLKQDGGSGEGSEALSAASAVPSFAAPLLQSLAWLSTEISASHVIRSTVCVLSGLPVVAERKVPPCPRAICRCTCLCLCMLRHPRSLTLPPCRCSQGKSSKHQHSVALSEPLERLQSDAGRFCIGATCCYPVPAAFHGESPILSSPCLSCS